MRAFFLMLAVAAFPSSAGRVVVYRAALPGYHFTFPKDHASHPEYQLEWWYYTGQVETSGGRTFGYELTFFRKGMDREYDNPSIWNVRQLHMAHFALSDLQDQRFHFFEKLNREGPGIAGAVTDTLNTWNENWSVKFDGVGMHLQAGSDEIEIRFDLVPEKPPAIHGEGGISQKAEGTGHASHYYSLTRLKTTGTIIFRGMSYTVNGDSWMDHEFGTNQLAPDQVGWDWFGLQLDDGSDLMLYRMRKRDGSVDRYSSATVVGQDQRIIHLNVESFQAVSSAPWRSPKTGVTYPLEWAITVPSEGLDLQVTPLMKDQELITTRSTGIAYWEGAVRVSGTHHGQPISGRGYLELTGYNARFRPKV